MTNIETIQPGQILKSVNTGLIVKVLSVDSDTKYFTGVCIGNAILNDMPDRFHWRAIFITASFQTI